MSVGYGRGVLLSPPHLYKSEDIVYNNSIRKMIPHKHTFCIEELVGAIAAAVILGLVLMALYPVLDKVVR